MYVFNKSFILYNLFQKTCDSISELLIESMKENKYEFFKLIKYKMFDENTVKNSNQILQDLFKIKTNWETPYKLFLEMSKGWYSTVSLENFESTFKHRLKLSNMNFIKPNNIYNDHVETDDLRQEMLKKFLIWAILFDRVEIAETILSISEVNNKSFKFIFLIKYK